MIRAVLGTAGHIDHGKSTLVKALTGIDPDRLPEEKARGITVDLGFAYLELPGVGRVGIVDVPGHERFVRTMVAGATGIDLVMLVVAADEGVKPQTVEHLEICSLLGVPRGVVALTKCDLVDAEVRELAREEVRDFLRGSPLEGAEIVAVSSKTGEGLDRLREVLSALIGTIRERGAGGVVRLPLDRAFAVKGHGTVVTGTMASGTLRAGDEVVLLPSGIRARARSLQVHGRDVAEASAGQRTAVNLPGVEKEAVQRGEILTAPEGLVPGRRSAASIRVLGSASRPLRPHVQRTLHVGTASATVRVRPLGVPEIPPGGEGYVEIVSERPLAWVRGDRFILRSHAENRTIAGGEILDPAPPRFPRATAPQGLLDDLARLRGGSPPSAVAEVYLRWAGPRGIDPAEIGRRTAWGGDAAEGALRDLGGDRVRPAGKRFVHGEVLRALGEETRRALEAFHREHPLRPGMARPELRERLGSPPEEVFERLLEELRRGGGVEVASEDVALAGRRPKGKGGPEQDRVRRLYEDAGLQPPTNAEAAARAGVSEKTLREVLALLTADRVLARIRSDLYCALRPLEDLKLRLVALLQERGAVTVAEFKDLAGVTRKHAIPLLEYFDRERVTLRSGDVRKAWSGR